MPVYQGPGLGARDSGFAGFRVGSWRWRLRWKMERTDLQSVLLAGSEEDRRVAAGKSSSFGSNLSVETGSGVAREYGYARQIFHRRGSSLHLVSGMVCPTEGAQRQRGPGGESRGNGNGGGNGGQRQAAEVAASEDEGGRRSVRREAAASATKAEGSVRPERRAAPAMATAEPQRDERTARDADRQKVVRPLQDPSSLCGSRRTAGPVATRHRIAVRAGHSTRHEQAWTNDGSRRRPASRRGRSASGPAARLGTALGIGTAIACTRRTTAISTTITATTLTSRTHMRRRITTTRIPSATARMAAGISTSTSTTTRTCSIRRPSSATKTTGRLRLPHRSVAASGTAARCAGIRRRLLRGHVDDFDGTFQSLRLEEGEYQVEMVLPGFEPLDFDVRITAGQKVTYRGDLIPEQP